MFARYFIVAASVAVLAGCSNQPHGPQVRPGDPASQTQPELVLDDLECRELAEKLSKAADSQDAAALAALFDWDALLHTATSDIQAPATVRQPFTADTRGDGKKAGE